MVYISDWDRVDVEASFRNYRLDVALLKDERIIAAIEVLVTHPTEAGKIDFLRHAGIPWMELTAQSILAGKLGPWDGSTPLDPLVCDPTPLPDFQCRACTNDLAAHLGHVRDATRRIEDTRKRREYASQFETLQLRYVDLYYPTGKRFRSIYIIQNHTRSGQIVGASLVQYAKPIRRITAQAIPINDHTYESLQKAADEDIRKLGQASILIDRSHPWWSRMRAFHPSALLDDHMFPPNYQWNGHEWRPKTQSQPPPIASIPAQPAEPHLWVPFAGEYPCEVCGTVTSDWVILNRAAGTCICRPCAYEKQ